MGTDKKRELKVALKPTIENLVCQEIRLLHFERMDTPSLIVEGIAATVRELKKELVNLTQSIAQKERTSLIKRMIRETLEEEIERTVQHRGNPCLRCSHLRYYDWEMNPHEKFPVGIRQAKAIGCDQLQGVSRVRCERFIETSGAISVTNYVEEITILYELREMFRKMKEPWEEYLMTRG